MDRPDRCHCCYRLFGRRGEAKRSQESVDVCRKCVILMLAVHRKGPKPRPA